MQNKIFSQSEAVTFRMLDGIFFTSVLETPAYTLATHKKAADYYSNLSGNIRCRPEDVDSTLDEIWQQFSNHKRSPTIYLTPFTQPGNLQSSLERRGLKPAYKDAWMYFRSCNKSSPTQPGVTIETVTTPETMRLFVDTFNHAYSGTDPREPYGQAPPEWGETLYASFGFQKPERQVDYFVLYDQGKPASVLLTTRLNNFGGIYSIGTSPKVRGKGHAASLTLHAVQHLLDQGANEIFLQTEKDSYNEKYYTKLGFTTEWVAEVWSVPQDKNTP
jgi:ribosomal protein S18 acetylase RimI-like enzyme